jgi:hypothetical protein
MAGWPPEKSAADRDPRRQRILSAVLSAKGEKTGGRPVRRPPLSQVVAGFQ